MTATNCGAGCVRPFVRNVGPCAAVVRGSRECAIDVNFHSRYRSVIERPSAHVYRAGELCVGRRRIESTDRRKDVGSGQVIMEIVNYLPGMLVAACDQIHVSF